MLFEGAEVQKRKTRAVNVWCCLLQEQTHVGNQSLCRLLYALPISVIYVTYIIRQCITLLSKEEGKTTGTFHTSLCILTHACCSSSIIVSAFTWVYSLHTVFSSLCLRLCGPFSKTQFKVLSCIFSSRFRLPIVSILFLCHKCLLCRSMIIREIASKIPTASSPSCMMFVHGTLPVVLLCCFNGRQQQTICHHGCIACYINNAINIVKGKNRQNVSFFTVPVFTFRQNSVCRIIKET